MKKISKILAILLSVVIFISIVPITASAATYTGKCGANVTWSYNTSTYTLTISGTGAMYDYALGPGGDIYPWYNYATNIKKVVINNGVTTIGKSAFDECTSLTSVTIPDSVTIIGNCAFQCCGNLTNVTISKSVTTIGEGAFLFCESLKDVFYGGTRAQWNNISIGDYNDDLYNATIHYTEVLSGTCGDNLTWEFDASTGTLTISGTGAMSESPWDSYYSEIKKVIIKNGVTSISAYAFVDCYNLESVTIPNTVTSIGNYAFAGCECLRSIVIPNGVTSIGDWAFGGCQYLYSLTIGNGVKTIGNGAFAGCKRLDSVTIPDSVTTIGDRAFSGCWGLVSVTIPKSVKTIGNGAFSDMMCLTDVYYSGTRAEWNNISIGDDNYDLYNATIHYHTHNYKPVVTPATCERSGYTTYTCDCGDTYVDEYVDALGHADNDDDGNCDMCNKQLVVDNDDGQTGFIGFIIKFINFILKLFGIN